MNNNYYISKNGTLVQVNRDPKSRNLNVVVWGWLGHDEQIEISNLIYDDFNIDAWKYFNLYNNMIFSDRSHVDVDVDGGYYSFIIK